MPRPRSIPATITLAFLVLATLAPGAASADTGIRYVSTSGSDANAGTLRSPWRSVETGLRRMRPGQTLYLRGGTYTETVDLDLPNGTSTARITVGSYPGERAVVRGLVRLRDADWWTFRRFHVTWGGGGYSDHMVKLIGGTGWILERSELWGARSFANLLVTGNPHRWVVRYNRIHDVYGGESNLYRSHNIYVHTGTSATAGRIARNIVYNASHGSNIKLGYGSGSDPATGTVNVVVRYNTLYSAIQPLVLAGPTLKHVNVYRNLIVKGTRPSGATYLVRLFEIRYGDDISVHHNLGSRADRFCNDYDGGWTCTRVNDGGNVFPRDPRFDSVTAGGFHPADSVARAYGRYAP